MLIRRTQFRDPAPGRRRARRLWLLLIVFIAVGFAALAWYKGALLPVDPGSDRRELFDVQSGESARAILARLEERGVIRSALAGKIHLSLGGNAGALQAGTFVLRPSMSFDEVVETIATGKAEETVLTIPEGSTVAEIDALLVKRGLANTGSLLLCAKNCDLSAFPFVPAASSVVEPGNRLEGYLYPDTYYVETINFDVQAFVARLLGTFQSKVIEGRAAELQASGRSLADVVTMASLLELESRGQDEQKVVSGILWKRLDEGMQLGVDAAVLYAVGKSTSGGPTGADLAVDSPYNLRRVRGLPPGAIGNPGLGAIVAALAPEASEYYYYLHAPNGQIHYGRTLEEHNANKARYL